MDDAVAFERQWWAYRARQRRLVAQAVELCTAACEVERAVWQSMLSGMNRVRRPAGADLLWETTERPLLWRRNERLILEHSCQGQARIWVEKRQELIKALQGLVEEAP